jgi:hypothetical protein
MQCKGVSSADHRHASRQEGDDKASSRAAATLPKNMIAALHLSRWTRRRQAFRRPTLLIPVRVGNWDGENYYQRKLWFCRCRRDEWMDDGMRYLSRCQRRRADAGDQEMGETSKNKRSREKPSSWTEILVTHVIRIGNSYNFQNSHFNQR